MQYRKVVTFIQARLSWDLMKKIAKKAKVYGADVKVKAYDGKTKVMSNNTFVAFAKSYTIFARDLKETELSYLTVLKVECL